MLATGLLRRDPGFATEPCWLIRPAHYDHCDRLTTTLNGPPVMQGLFKGVEDDVLEIRQGAPGDTYSCV